MVSMKLIYSFLQQFEIKGMSILYSDNRNAETILVQDAKKAGLDLLMHKAS